MNIADKIFSNMPSDLNNLEKARYLYLELCKSVTFSTKYNNSSIQDFSRLYNKVVDVTNLDTTEVNCRMWSQLYSQLLNIAGIENEIIDKGHQSVVFYYDDKKWMADATYGTYTDLSRVRNDDETAGFGLCTANDVVIIDDDTSAIIDNIDQKIGYNIDYRENLMEFKDYLTKIKKGEIDISTFSHANEITLENELTFKLEYLFSTIGKLKSGYYEVKDFVRNLESFILTSEEMENVGAVELKKTNKDMTVDIAQCIYAKCGDEFKYYILAPNIKIQQFSKEQIIKMAMMGYGIEEKQIPDIVYPRNFKVGEVSKNYNYKLYNFISNIFSLPQDPIFSNLEEAYRVR